MVVLCVARHLYLAQHLARMLGQAGATTRAAVGLAEAASAAADCSPDVVAAEYDLLATLPLGSWETDEVLSRRPVIAVSLTRRSGEWNALDKNGIAGYLYLPEVGADAVMRVLTAAARTVVRAPESLPLSWSQEHLRL
ncbi:MAG: hypothetical protein HOQ11_13310 [Gemmatimonadaceae bacterium]|nr:hypothetical protein [Gemmatimonadaceae bacterium]NUQ92203.1 hypothetical protein [Gemmatimonadaceae bacterium]NUR18329.1 hypothetical protein [Gemmatimonadaceae bacterium]NUS98377.1 hypothetical protein [Gemmatimonadaceae bacterium]